MANYMREKNNAKVSQEISAVSTKNKHSSASLDETRPQVPRVIPGAFEHEPLASFIRSLDSKEVFMFDYCERPFFVLPLLIFGSVTPS
jgi:hypothetical protein